MKKKNSTRDNTPAMDYVMSLRHAVKRRFGLEHLAWVRAGRVGSGPSRGHLSPTESRVVSANIDMLA